MRSQCDLILAVRFSLWVNFLATIWPLIEILLSLVSVGPLHLCYEFSIITWCVLLTSSTVHHCLRLRLVWTSGVWHLRLSMVGEPSRLVNGAVLHPLYASSSTGRHSLYVRHSQTGQCDRRCIVYSYTYRPKLNTQTEMSNNWVKSNDQDWSQKHEANAKGLSTRIHAVWIFNCKMSLNLCLHSLSVYCCRLIPTMPVTRTIQQTTFR